MKKAFCCLLSSASILLAGCERDENALSVSPVEDVYFSEVGTSFSDESVKIQVTASLGWWAWDVATDQQWCKLSVVRSQGYFEIGVRPNTDFAARTATVTVSGPGAVSVSIRVHQAASSSLEITPSDEQQISEKGGTIPVKVKSDAFWTAESNRTWAVVGMQSGHGDATTQITVAPNPNRETDRAAITFRAGSQVRKVIVERASNPYGTYITIDPVTTRHVAASGGSFTVTINSNTFWKVSSDKAWVTVETESGTGNGSTRIVVAENTGFDTSTATLVFRAGTAYKQLTIERASASEKYRYICEGYSTRVVYTIDGKYIKKGYTSTVAYTIDGKYIKRGHSSTVAFTIDGKYIKQGYSSTVAYTIDGKYIKEGYSSTVAFNLK